MAKSGPKHYDGLVKKELKRINLSMREQVDEMLEKEQLTQDKAASECIKSPSIISRLLAVDANNTMVCELEMLIPLGYTMEKRIVPLRL